MSLILARERNNDSINSINVHVLQSREREDLVPFSADEVLSSETQGGISKKPEGPSFTHFSPNTYDFTTVLQILLLMITVKSRRPSLRPHSTSRSEDGKFPESLGTLSQPSSLSITPLVLNTQ